MLRTLSVSNYAIVRDLSVEFDTGLTILSGETGAGKSILVGALNLILGERASTEMVRAGEDIAVVEAEICDVPDNALEILHHLEIDTNSDKLTLRREVQAKGSSRALVNGRMVPLSSLKAIGSTMFDLVGQHQQQYLIAVEHHIEFLDSFADLISLRAEVSDLFDRRSSAKRKLETLRANAQRNSEMTELYKFQVREIEQAELSLEEDDELNVEKRVLENADKLRAALGSVADGLAISDDAVSVRLSQLEAMIQEIVEIDPGHKASLEGMAGARYVLEDIGRTLSSRAESVQANPTRLLEIESRLDTYYELKKKYGGSIEALNDYYAKAKTQLESNEDLSEQILKQQAELRSIERELSDAVITLSQKREENAAKLSKCVEKELRRLGIPKGQIEARLTRREDESGLIDYDNRRYRVERDGIDDVEFYFSANRGEELRPLAKIASGGELSRVMLALKSVGAAKKKLETLVFDEVDSGIGGEVAAAVGRKLRELSKKHQVIVITHLQQIAAAGEHHYCIYKKKSNGRMVTKIQKLSDDERRDEIGRMLSGDKLTETSLKQADELLGEFDRS